MRKMVYLLVGVLILLVGCQEEAQDHDEDVNEQEEKKTKSIDETEINEEDIISVEDFDLPDRTKGFFWTGTDGKNQFHFLGTMHIGTEDMYPFEEDIESALENSDFLLVEKHFSEDEQDLTQEYFYYPNGETLEDHMPEELVDSIRDYSTKIKARFGQLNSMKPYALSKRIINYEIGKKGLTSDYSVEEYLTKTKPKNTEIIGLEGRERYELIHNQPDDYYAYMLEQTIDNMDKQINEGIKSFAGYRLGDESMLTDIKRTVDSNSENQKYEQMYIDNMMVKRDQMMADRIAEISNEYSGKNFFVAVGTAHFFNEGNVLELLKDKGFEIERN